MVDSDLCLVLKGQPLRENENSENLSYEAQQGGGLTGKAQCTSLHPSMVFDVVCAQTAPLDENAGVTKRVSEL